MILYGASITLYPSLTKQQSLFLNEQYSYYFWNLSADELVHVQSRLQAQRFVRPGRLSRIVWNILPLRSRKYVVQHNNIIRKEKDERLKHRVLDHTAHGA